MAALLVLVGYWFFYKPPQKKIARLSMDIESARAMSAAGSQYQELRAQLSTSYGNLPYQKDQQQWLSNAMIDSLRVAELTPEVFRPVVENEVSGIVFQNSTVQLTVKFGELYSWLVRLESASPLMHVSAIQLLKKADTSGVNTVTCTVMTAIPKKRFN